MLREFILLMEEKAKQAESQATRIAKLNHDIPRGCGKMIIKPYGYFMAVVVLWDDSSSDSCRWARACWNTVVEESHACRKFCEENPWADFGIELQRLKAAWKKSRTNKSGGDSERGHGVARACAKKDGGR